MAPDDVGAKVKMLWNKSIITPTKISTPQTRWVRTRSSLSLKVSVSACVSVVTASCLMAYAFYTMAPETVEKYRTDRLAWTIPFVLYGIFRYLYLVHQKDQGGSPTDLLLTDRPLLLDVALWALSVVVIVYSAGGAPMPRIQ